MTSDPVPSPPDSPDDEYEAFICGNAVDGYEMGVKDNGSIMQGRVIQRYDARRDGVVRSLRRARKIAARMLAEQRKRDATRAEERFS